LNELCEANEITKKYLEEVIYSIEKSNDIENLFEIKAELEPETVPKEKIKKAIEPEKIELEDATIFVGKNNRQNDYIISKLAKDEDIWFHTKDCAGSHVLLKTTNLTDELILKCAKIAKEFSSGADSSKIGVIYTKRKYLRKPPAATLGYVTYKNEKEIVLD